MGQEKKEALVYGPATGTGSRREKRRKRKPDRAGKQEKKRNTAGLETPCRMLSISCIYAL